MISIAWHSWACQKLGLPSRENDKPEAGLKTFGAKDDLLLHCNKIRLFGIGDLLPAVSKEKERNYKAKISEFSFMCTICYMRRKYWEI